VRSPRQINRSILLTGRLLVVAGVLYLSAATRKPYRTSNGLTWHISKAGKMSKSAFYASDGWRQARIVEADRINGLSFRSASPLVAHQDAEPYIPQVDPRNYHFRSPPASL
jgi:hypothetical protein